MVGYKLFLCALFHRGGVNGSASWWDCAHEYVGVGQVLLRMRSSTSHGMNSCGRVSLLQSMDGSRDVELNGFVTNPCNAQVDHHFDFKSAVNAHLQGVIKCTLHVLRGLCAVPADVMKLPWRMAAINVTKQCGCALWNRPLWHSCNIPKSTRMCISRMDGWTHK